MLDISFLCKADLETLKKNVGFSAEEEKVLDALYLGDCDDGGIMFKLNISSRNHFYEVKKSMLRKIIVTAIRK